MQRILSGSPKFIVAFLLFLSVWGCTKIDTTTLGSDLVPDVDNIHTFADTLLINGTQGVFDDTFTRVSYTDYHALGTITNDPVFGTTSSDLYLQLKPNFYPFYFGNAGDTINDVIAPAIGSNGTSFDSVVLCLSYKTFFGDTTAPQSLSVYQLDNNVSNFKDSSYKLNFRPDQVAGETLLGSVTMDPRRVRDLIRFKGSKKDSVTNQVRIRLNDAFLQSLIRFNRDTVTGHNGMYYSDSLFKDKIRGFRIKADGVGNGLFYVSLTDATTRLEVHYKKVRNNVVDTSFSSFYFSTGISSSLSAQATHMERDRSGAEVSSPLPEALYIQSSPGTYANLSIPALSGFQNSIIHRAEIVIEQIPTFGNLDKAMLPPAYLFLDLINDTSVTNKFKPVYYDLNPSSTYLPDNTIYFLPTAGIDYTYFGGYLRQKDAGGGNARYYYTFNLSRHVQHIVTNGMNNYKYRLYAPVNLSYYGYSVSFRNLLADGRVKIGNGNNTAGYKMYMRIVWSKI